MRLDARLQEAAVGRRPMRLLLCCWLLCCCLLLARSWLPVWLGVRLVVRFKVGFRVGFCVGFRVRLRVRRGAADGDRHRVARPARGLVRRPHSAAPLLWDAATFCCRARRGDFLLLGGFGRDGSAGRSLPRRRRAWRAGRRRPRRVRGGRRRAGRWRRRRRGWRRGREGSERR